MTPEISKKLVTLGLSEKEAVVYPALLKLELATVRELTNETGLNRSTLYVVLERLKKRGLVSIASERGVRKYVPASPERLLRQFTDQTEHYRIASKELRAILPSLASAHRGGRYKPRVVVLKGLQGLEDGFEDSLRLHDPPMRVVSSGPEIFRTLSDYLPKYVQRRMQRGIAMTGIHPDEPRSMGAFMRMPVSKALDRHFFIPQAQYKFPADLGIYDDKTSFMSHLYLFTAIIKSKEIADLMRTVFDLATKQAERIGKEFP